MTEVPDPCRVSGWATHGLISELARSTGFFADSLDSQFNMVNKLSEQAFIEMVDKVMQPYTFTPESESKVTNFEEVQDAILGLKVGKLPGPNGIPNGAVQHLPPIVSLLDRFINAIF